MGKINKKIKWALCILVWVVVITYLVFSWDNGDGQLVFQGEYDGYMSTYINNNDTTDSFIKNYYQNVISHDVYFDIRCDADININDSDFVFVIIKGSGIFYKGSFNNHIELKDKSFSIDDYKVEMLGFVLLDHKTKLTYKWDMKEVWRLYKWKNYKVTLNKDGTFDISFCQLASPRYRFDGTILSDFFGNND